MQCNNLTYESAENTLNATLAAEDTQTNTAGRSRIYGRLADLYAAIGRTQEAADAKKKSDDLSKQGEAKQ
jgi:hypothetical protein